MQLDWVFAGKNAFLPWQGKKTEKMMKSGKIKLLWHYIIYIKIILNIFGHNFRFFDSHCQKLCLKGVFDMMDKTVTLSKIFQPWYFPLPHCLKHLQNFNCNKRFLALLWRLKSLTMLKIIKEIPLILSLIILV